VADPLDHEGHPFFAIVARAERDGVKSICDLPGCWELTAGAWWVAVNGHREPTKCSRGVEVPGFHAYVEFNGWPAGIFSPHGTGEFVVSADANAAAFIAALEAGS
jgi:hypothetical protein